MKKTPIGFSIKILALALFPVFFFNSCKADSSDPLSTLNKEHPRLLATAKDFDRLKKAAETDPLQAEINKRILATAEAALNAPLKKYEFGERFGHRHMLPLARAMLQRITIQAVAYRISHDKRFAEKGKAELLSLVNFPDWNDEKFLDLSEFTLAVSLGYDWLYDTLTPEERLAVKTALMQKGLHHVAEIYTPPYTTSEEMKRKNEKLWWVTVNHNWNQVCHTGQLAAALAIADEEPDLARTIIRGVRHYLPYAMHSYAPSGAWPEGPGYWSYATTFNILAIAMLESAIGNDQGLCDVEPMFSKTAVFRMQMASPSGVMYNYADVATSWENGGLTAAFSWLANRYGPSITSDFFRKSIEKHFSICKPDKEKDRLFPFQFFWLSPAPKKVVAADLDAHFPGDADVAVFRSEWANPDALYLGFKAGTNGVNHGHLDLGSFILDSDSQRWSVELGPDSYALPDYFGKKRWTYYRLLNLIHSTITPAETIQDTKATAPIVSFKSTPKMAGAVADLTPAYPLAAKKMLRGAFMLDRARVLIQDDFSELEANTQLNWRMVTDSSIQVSADKRSAVLTKNGKTLRAEILSPSNAEFSIAGTKPPTPAENQNEGTSILLAKIPASPKINDVRVAVLLSPVGPKWPTNLPAPALIDLSTP